MSKRLTTTLATLLLLTILNSGCASTSTPTPKSAVLLPAPPAFMAAVKEPMFKAGDSPNVAFHTELVALRSANRQLAASRAWYLGVRGRYAKAKLK